MNPVGMISLIGNTPLIELKNYQLENECCSKIFAKLEGSNPFGSIKDRVAFSMIENAEKKGFLKKGYTIIEPTSGNTGIALAAIAAIKHYKIIITMPSSMSSERITLLKLYGAKVILTPGKDGMKGAIKKALELHKEIKNSYIPNQFSNIVNPYVHEKTTAREILNTNIDFDFFVSGVGSGGTLTGIARAFKKAKKNTKIIAVEPETSAVLSGEEPGSHNIQGIGAGFIPSICDTTLIDNIIKVSDSQAINEVKNLAKTDGILIGISSGAALYAAKKIALENKDKNIVVIFPDSGERYLSNYISGIS